jgi:sec-independent protein translocase protein TatA
MGFGSIWHWVVVLLVVLLLFGTGKISGIMGDFAKGIKAFKKGLKDDDEGDETAARKLEGGNVNATAKEKDTASV